MTLSPATRCQATTAAGAPCKGTPAPGGLLCRAHDPEHREAMQAARSRGGQRGAATKARQAEADANPLAHLPMTTLDECRTAAEAVTRAVLAGTLPARSGQVAASLIRAAMTAIQAAETEALAAEVEAARAAAPPSVGRRRR